MDGKEHKMKVIGITGGIGSGKSLVAKLLEKNHGAFLLNTDQIAKEQMKVGGVCYRPVVNYFGTEILSEDGAIDRSKLAEIVFHDKDKLLKLNQLTHPLVLEAVQEEIEKIRKSCGTKYLIIETALMIESGYDSTCDEVWYVYSSEVDRRERLKRERNYSDAKIDAIFTSQSTAEAFRKKFSKVIENTGDIENLEQQVDQLIKNDYCL
jgi:dephospho-CoA kinase